MNFMLNKRKSIKAAWASPQTPLGELSALPQNPLAVTGGGTPPPVPSPSCEYIYQTPPFPIILDPPLRKKQFIANTTPSPPSLPRPVYGRKRKGSGYSSGPSQSAKRIGIENKCEIKKLEDALGSLRAHCPASVRGGFGVRRQRKYIKGLETHHVRHSYARGLCVQVRITLLNLSKGVDAGRPRQKDP